MDTAKLRAALTRAQEVGPRIAQAADSLNASFLQLEQALREVGVRVYVSVRLSDEWDDELRMVVSQTSLAWTKLDGTWSLAIVVTWPDDGRETHVTAASLEDRKCAARDAHKLVSAMADALERQLAEVDEARGQVDAVAGIVRGAKT